MFPIQLGPLASPPGLLVGLLVIAGLLLVGRFLMNLAWKLVLIGVVVVATLWVLGILGFQFGILTVGPVATMG
jgi:uncharacterized BrkB/YihY/UPF0761 family membrane protein